MISADIWNANCHLTLTALLHYRANSDQVHFVKTRIVDRRNKSALSFFLVHCVEVKYHYKNSNTQNFLIIRHFS